MEKRPLKLKNDKFRKARGGRSRILNLYCFSCNKRLALYQKDGPGPLKRLYIDRIISPETKWKKGSWHCSKCKAMLGTFYIYEKEDRRAIRLYQDSVYKKISK